MDNEEPFVIQSDSDNLERGSLLVIAEVKGTVVWDRRPRWRRLVKDEAAMSHDELDLSLRDAVFERRVCEDEVHTWDIVRQNARRAPSDSDAIRRGEVSIGIATGPGDRTPFVGPPAM